MPTVEVIALNRRGQDVSVGRISVGPESNIQIDPPDSIMLQNMISEPIQVARGTFVTPKQGAAFVSALPRKYSSAYLRASIVPDTPVTVAPVAPTPNTPAAPTAQAGGTVPAPSSP